MSDQEKGKTPPFFQEEEYEVRFSRLLVIFYIKRGLESYPAAEENQLTLCDDLSKTMDTNTISPERQNAISLKMPWIQLITLNLIDVFILRII